MFQDDILTTTQLQQVENHIDKILPLLLTRNPAIVLTIEGILAQHFPKRDEFARLLDEVQGFRKEVDLRFNQVDQRLDGVDQRLDGIDQRLDGVDQRLDGIDQRLDGVDQRLESLTDEMNQRFEKVEKTQLEMRRDMAKLNAGQENIIKRMDNMEDWFNFLRGEFGNQKGGRSEDLVAAALRYGLQEDDIDADTIRLRQPLSDPTGLVFQAGYKSEIDIIAQNGHMTIFEVKTTYVKPGEVAIFAFKRDLFDLQNPDIEVKGLLIVPGANERTQQECDEYGIRLLT